MSKLNAGHKQARLFKRTELTLFSLITQSTLELYHFTVAYLTS